MENLLKGRMKIQSVLGDTSWQMRRVEIIIHNSYADMSLLSTSTGSIFKSNRGQLRHGLFVQIAQFTANDPGLLDSWSIQDFFQLILTWHLWQSENGASQSHTGQGQCHDCCLWRVVKGKKTTKEGFPERFENRACTGSIKLIKPRDRGSLGCQYMRRSCWDKVHRMLSATPDLETFIAEQTGAVCVGHVGFSPPRYTRLMTSSSLASSKCGIISHQCQNKFIVLLSTIMNHIPNVLHYEVNFHLFNK